MLPNTHNAPTPQAKLFGLRSVPLDVAPDFGFPIRTIYNGNGAATWAAMPKAAVYEYRQSRTGKREIGLSRYRIMPPPAGDMGVAENGDKG